jgi:phage N-6-adenine-methyltransferase
VTGVGGQVSGNGCQVSGAGTHLRSHSFDVMKRSNDTTWATPQQWYDYLDLEFKFTLDPCCSPATAKCKRYYTEADNGLEKSWADERVFMNPPYGKALPLWMQKAYNEARYNGALVVCLVPARVDTRWWHNTAAKAADVRFPIGRIKFENSKNPAPFPVSIVVFRPWKTPAKEATK